MAKRVPVRLRRFPSIQENAFVNEPTANPPEFITFMVVGDDGKETSINYVRQDTLPPDLATKVGKAVVSKVLGMGIFDEVTKAAFGRRLLSIASEEKSDETSPPQS
jgi:hypothetical protein